MPKQQLTPKEQIAIDNLTSAIKAMPSTLCLEIDNGHHTGSPAVEVHKRTQDGSILVKVIKKSTIAN